MMTTSKLDQLKLNYAEMIVDGMDMNTLITFAVESIEHNMKDWDEEDVKSEILDDFMMKKHGKVFRNKVSYL